MLAHRFRHQHAAGLAQLLQSRGDVDAVAQDELAVGDHVAEIDADAELEAPVGRHPRLVGRDRLLHLDGAQHGIDHRAELDQHAIADDLHEPPMMRAQQRLHDLVAQPLQPGDGAGFVQLHQARVADHIGRQNRGKAALDLRCLQWRSSNRRAAAQRPRRMLTVVDHASRMPDATAPGAKVCRQSTQGHEVG